jgi:hypothetical protein
VDGGTSWVKASGERVCPFKVGKQGARAFLEKSKRSTVSGKQLNRFQGKCRIESIYASPKLGKY